MGCGSGKLPPEAPEKGYAGVVRSLAAFGRARDGGGEDEPKKSAGKRGGSWFSTGGGSLPPASNSRPLIQDKVTKYRDKFDPRVTARYDIRALIGRGSFSRVVRVEHRATRQPRGGREVCASELAVLRRVSHSHVIRLIEVFQFPRRVYVVLELATGGELLDRVVSRGHFTERDAARALRMVLAGLGHLHDLGIAHRDLKPENLLYYHPGADSRLLVTDFGLATFADGTWCLTTTCGTPEYMAPEVLLRKPYSCAVDMWALGVVAYVVLSGSMPFEDDSRTRLYRSIVRGKFGFRGDPWPSVSNLAKDFVQRLLPLDPGARLTAAQAIRHPWVVTVAAGSSMKNLHRSISQNLRSAVVRLHIETERSSSARSPAPWFLRLMDPRSHLDHYESLPCQRTRDGSSS
uniref:Si:ch211-27e6.1 n=1 Tax=Cyclopterus lumpus TaxID=8103 RepID=A0A8C2XKN4_CYCLU